MEPPSLQVLKTQLVRVLGNLLCLFEQGIGPDDFELQLFCGCVSFVLEGEEIRSRWIAYLTYPPSTYIYEAELAYTDVSLTFWASYWLILHIVMKTITGKVLHSMAITLLFL